METDEDLESGYGATAPPGDNLCNDYAQGLARAFTSLARARGDRLDEADLTVTMSDAASGSPFANVAVVRRPVDESAWPALAARIHDFYRGSAGGPFLLFSAWPTPDLGSLGFGRVGHPPLMFRPATSVTDGPIDGLEIVAVSGSASARDWEFAVVHGYPEPALQPFQPGCLLPEAALEAPGWHHWVGYLDGEPVSTASAYVGDHHVDVEFIATIASARARGIGRTMTATATAAAPELPAMLISSDEGRGIYQRLGFLPILRFSLWAGHRS